MLKKVKKTFYVILALVMCINLLPVKAFADEVEDVQVNDAPEADAGKEFSFTLNMVLHDDEIDVGTLTGLINTFLTQEGRQLISDDEKERICSELIQALLGPDPVTEFAFSTTFTLKDGETATLKNLGYATTYQDK